jgi:uncharacterized cofD-like protein
MFKAVIFGGGSGLSQLLKGMVNFPWEVTAVVSVSDNGKSTGALRKEFDIPAVGDITKVMMAMSDKPQTVKDLFMYRFDEQSSLNGHSIKNLIMTALLEMQGDFTHSIPILAELLDIKGNIFPVTEDNVDLVGIADDIIDERIPFLLGHFLSESVEIRLFPISCLETGLTHLYCLFTVIDQVQNSQCLR